jgi:uncharacterized protein YdeI (YjbR/CyaY-like superfamily)
VRPDDREGSTDGGGWRATVGTWSAEPVADDLPIMTFTTADEFDQWLEANPDSPGIWLLLAKKNSNVSTVSYAEAVHVSLCHGWIDSQARKHDDDTYRQRFTPRRKRSPWSQINRELAEQFMAEGRMRAGGLAQVEAAKADGRWDKAYPPQSTAEVPADLTAALDANPAARSAYDDFNSQNRFALIFRLSQLEGDRRRRRIDEFVTKVASGWKPYP